jgi:transcriptional regulator with XRE-family HTH domain
MSIYAKRIVELREKAGLSQVDLAFDCGWRASRQSNYETGYRTPKIEDLTTIGQALDKYLENHTIVFLVTG